MSKLFIIKPDFFRVAMLLMAIFLLDSMHSNGQYYYRDIVSSIQASADMAAYKSSQIKSVKIRSFESDGTASDDFFCERKISKDYLKSALYTRTGMNGVALMESYFNENGQLISTYDSSDLAIRTTYYRYDNSGHLIENLMKSRSSDDDYVNEVTETHLFLYDDEGMLKSMTRIKNNTDRSTIFFSCDEKSNVTIEKNDKEFIIYYYYYDENNRLTDVVHSVPYKEKLIADYVFDYDNTGLPKSMITTRTGRNDYTVWHFEHQNGLKSSETATDKDGRIMGKITYEYK